MMQTAGLAHKPPANLKGSSDERPDIFKILLRRLTAAGFHLYENGTAALMWMAGHFHTGFGKPCRFIQFQPDGVRFKQPYEKTQLSENCLIIRQVFKRLHHLHTGPAGWCIDLNSRINRLKLSYGPVCLSYRFSKLHHLHTGPAGWCIDFEQPYQ